MPHWRPQVANILKAAQTLNTVMKPTPTSYSIDLSAKHGAQIWFKEEHKAHVKSYKGRGAYNKMASLPNKNPIVTCSAGNHAQGVAFACKHLEIPGEIYMPEITTKQKIDRVAHLGGPFVKIHLVGSNFDESYNHASKAAQNQNKTFVHPFDDQAVIEGQGTVGVEIMEHFTSKPLDYLILPIGGGGLCAGVSSYVKAVSPHTKIIGVEPLGAPSMYESIKQNKIVTLQDIDTFVDGAAVKRVGTLNYPICKEHLHSICLIDEGHVCSKIIQMYNEHGLIIEPAGVLSLCALDQIESDIKGKSVVTVISGGNSDAFRMPEILERALIYEGRKHYFRIEFPQKAGALKNFIMNMLGPNDDIIYFRYTKLINKESGPVILGIETKSKDDIKLLIHNMEQYKCVFTKLKSV